jgi:hypothetical protein
MPLRSVLAPSPCQLIKTNLSKEVFGSSTFTNAYIILQLFRSSVSSSIPPEPLLTNFKMFVWPSYANKALNKLILGVGAHDPSPNVIIISSLLLTNSCPSCCPKRLSKLIPAHRGVYLGLST